MIGQEIRSDREAARYTALLAEAPIDIVCLGIGVNGHLAFNDPPVATGTILSRSRSSSSTRSAVSSNLHDKCFAALDDVPTHAITLTIPRLLDAHQLFCVVPGAAKRTAVEQSLYGPIGAACPASALRTHPRCTLYLDRDSAHRSFRYKPRHAHERRNEHVSGRDPETGQPHTIAILDGRISGIAPGGDR